GAVAGLPGPEQLGFAHRSFRNLVRPPRAGIPPPLPHAQHPHHAPSPPKPVHPIKRRFPAKGRQSASSPSAAFVTLDGSRTEITTFFRSTRRALDSNRVRLFENAKDRKSENAKLRRMEPQMNADVRRWKNQTIRAHRRRTADPLKFSSRLRVFVFKMPFGFRVFALSRFRVLKQSGLQVDPAGLNS